MTVKKLDREKCTGCGACVACCPMEAITVIDDNGEQLYPYR
jgi:ferredoxin